MEGKAISGYTLQRRLGVGGMAEVWLAENAIGKKAAVKLLLPKFCQDDAIVARFENEAKVMVKLDHPNIRQVYDYGSTDDRPCIVMEYLEGDDLKALMKSGKRFTETELRKWWNQIADALNYTHAEGIVHRDIKPSNIFLDKKGNIKLLDFGIAKIKESISMTQTGSMMGTLMYMSPEQVRDSKHIGPESDAYSLAVSFVHLLSGKKPYDSDTSSDYDIRKGIVEIPLDLSGVPTDWQGFLAPYLAKDPAQRPALRPFEAVPLPEKNETPQPVDDDEGTIVENVKKPEPKHVVEPAPKSRPDPVKTEVKAPKSTDKPKSKKGLWIGIGIAAIVALALLLLLIKPKEEKYDNKQASDRNEPYVTDSPAIAQTQQLVEKEAQTQANAGAELEQTSKPADKKAASLCEEPRFADLFQLPYGLKGYFNYDQAMVCAQAQNKPLFVYFTAHVSDLCHEMEANVWKDPRVLKLLREEYVIAALYVDDKTELPENEWYTSTYDGKVKKIIGRKCIDFQISEFGTNTQPYYCLLDNKSNLIIKPCSYSLDKEAFLQFLQKGIDDFKKGVYYQKKQIPSGSITSNTSENSNKNRSMNGMIDPIRWTFEIKKRGNDEFDIVATATIDPKFYINSTKMPEVGPMPTVFEIDPSVYFEAVGNARDLTEGELYYDDVFDVEYRRFHGKASFAQTFKILQKGSFPVTGRISGQLLTEWSVIPVYEDIDLMYR